MRGGQKGLDCFRVTLLQDHQLFIASPCFFFSQPRCLPLLAPQVHPDSVENLVLVLLVAVFGFEVYTMVELGESVVNLVVAGPAIAIRV